MLIRNLIFYGFLLIALTNLSAQLLTRTAEIKEPSGREIGFGSVVSGVDFDKDGRPEIYTCNNNFIDRPNDLTPRIYKFELNPVTAKWDSVWCATAPLSFQNTWPSLTWGDTDKDGRPELYWGIINYSPYPDAPRILVYEYPGDGSENMGVASAGGFLPNASTNILAGVGNNIRPLKMIIADPDNDAKDELIFCDRAGTMHIGVLSVDNIPDLGTPKETWTLEYSGQGVAAFGTTAKYDITILNNVIYLFDSGGKVYGMKYTSGSWQAPKVQTSMMTISSFKGTQVVDINKDGKKEILMADWLTNTKGAGAKVWLLQQVADTLQASALVDFEPLGAVRLNGSAFGDLDGDGNLDFVCSARYDANNSKKVPVFRMEYQGGDIINLSNYVASVIDSAYWTNNGDMDVISIANIDGDSDDEVMYTQGYSRGNTLDARMPLIVLDKIFTPLNSQYSIKKSISQDWNLLSMPSKQNNMSKEVIFKNSISNAFGYDNGYVTSNPLQLGKGYWLKFSNSETIQFSSETTFSEVNLVKGWNLIGVSSKSVLTANAITTPTGILQSGFYGYNNGYFVADTLKPASGYWVLSSDGGKLLLNNTLPKTNWRPSVNKDWAKLSVEDAQGKESILYIAKSKNEISEKELPPLPPKEVFDARWLTNRLAEELYEKKDIQISSAAYPIRLKVEGIDVGIKDKINGQLVDRKIRDGESLVVTNSSITRLEITLQSKEENLPTEFMLYQNYPNPFNPTTNIKFVLPQNGRAKLTIYNSLGEKVTELIDKDLEAGYHEVEWNATSFSSGVYFYEIINNSTKAYKKMMLVK